MLRKVPKLNTNLFPKNFGSLRQAIIPSYRHFSSYLNQKGSSEDSNNEFHSHKDSVDFLNPVNPYINSYMRNFYQYLAAASVVGITSAQLLALSVPLGFPSAFLILTGFGLEHLGSDYINRTRPNVYAIKNQLGKIEHGYTNPTPRKFAFLSTCIGYGCIMGSLLGVIPLSPSVIPLSAVMCLFSTFGHFNYCKFSPTSQFKPAYLILSGLLSGVLGLNFVTSSSTIFMWENPLHIESIQVSTYLGLLLYNAFAGFDSKKTVEDINNGKGDYLKHANRYGENWLYALIPHFMMNVL